MRTALLALVAALGLATAASAQPRTVVLWHVFTLETDMIHGAVKSFNAAHADLRIEARIVPGPQISTELVKEIGRAHV